VTNEVLGKEVGGRKEQKPEEPKADPRIEALEKELAGMRRREQELQFNQAKQNFRDGLKRLAEAEPEKYELVRGLEAYDEAVTYVIDYHNKHGVLPGESEEQAMAVALAHIESQHEDRLFKPGVLTSNKLKSRLSSAAPKQASERPHANPAKSPPSSLTNSLASGAPLRATKPEPETPDDYRRLAAAVLASDDAG
jgi:hypothetical protein